MCYKRNGNYRKFYLGCMNLYPSLQDRLNNQHQAIKEIIADISNERIHEELINGKWSIHDNIAHLARFQPIFIERIETIILNDEPSFESYTAELDEEFEVWRNKPTIELLEQLYKDRKLLFRLLSLMPGEKLLRAGIHKKYGRLNMLQWTEFFLLHEAHHILTIFKLANGIV
ncbi:DinB superfamily protein [mine drainage metagenome]|uniref:DinB superfamily protein n=1 Tax=mine drainage metagenome TaxID=410659 RepID=A0A1J5RZW4_9ZZZZ